MAVPLGPVAVIVYVVVCAGVTDPWPFNGMLFTSSCGMAGLIVTDVAFVVVHEMVLNCPAVMVVGEAAIVAVGLVGGGGGGGGGGFCVDDPPPAQEVKIVASRKTLTNPRKTCENLRTMPSPILLTWKARTKAELPLDLP